MGSRQESKVAARKTYSSCNRPVSLPGILERWGSSPQSRNFAMTDKEELYYICESVGLVCIIDADDNVFITIPFPIRDELTGELYSVVMKRECPSQALLSLYKILDELHSLNEDIK